MEFHPKLPTLVPLASHDSLWDFDRVLRRQLAPNVALIFMMCQRDISS